MTRKIFTVVVCENRTHHSAEQSIQRALVAGLHGRRGLDLVIMPHLYDLAPDGPAMQFLRGVRGDLAVVGWLYPRAAYWVLSANRIHGRMGHTALFPDEELEALPPLPSGKSRRRVDRDSAHRTIWCIDLREYAGAEPVLAEVERIGYEVLGPSFAERDEAADASANGAIHFEEPTHPRWYPVVDYDRCGNCQKCKDFCPFEVFGVDEQGKLLVVQPDDCVGSCLACARICESGAILIAQEEHLAIAGDTRAARNDMKSGPAKPCDTSGVENFARAERDRAVAASKDRTWGKPK